MARLVGVVIVATIFIVALIGWRAVTVLRSNYQSGDPYQSLPEGAIRQLMASQGQKSPYSEEGMSLYAKRAVAPFSDRCKALVMEFGNGFRGPLRRAFDGWQEFGQTYIRYFDLNIVSKTGALKDLLFIENLPDLLPQDAKCIYVTFATVDGIEVHLFHQGAHPQRAILDWNARQEDPQCSFYAFQVTDLVETGLPACAHGAWQIAPKAADAPTGLLDQMRVLFNKQTDALPDYPDTMTLLDMGGINLVQRASRLESITLPGAFEAETAVFIGLRKRLFLPFLYREDDRRAARDPSRELITGTIRLLEQKGWRFLPVAYIGGMNCLPTLKPTATTRICEADSTSIRSPQEELETSQNIWPIKHLFDEHNGVGKRLEELGFIYDRSEKRWIRKFAVRLQAEPVL